MRLSPYLSPYLSYLNQVHRPEAYSTVPDTFPWRRGNLGAVNCTGRRTFYRYSKDLHVIIRPLGSIAVVSLARRMPTPGAAGMSGESGV
jgi:hypothetical protein